jgi:GNAT superfamily N-acetyltransferase
LQTKTNSIGRMKSHSKEIEKALEVFVRGFCADKSRTHPYEYFRVGKIWVMRDAPRKNPKDYRKEEWVAYGVEAKQVDAAARKTTRGRFFVCAVRAMDEPEEPLKASYKDLGYRLLSTEPLFVHRLKKLSRAACTATFERVTTEAMAERYGKASRTRPIPAANLVEDAPFRQYVALDGEKIIGAVRSVDAGDATWCSNMYVWPSYRRRGIGSALLCHMLRDDRARGFKQSVLLSSHAGALLYPRVGYEQIGMLYIFAPRKRVIR